MPSAGATAGMAELFVVEEGGGGAGMWWEVGGRGRGGIVDR